MKSNHWRTFLALATGAMLSLTACTKAAESKSLEAAPAEPAANTAPATAQDNAAPAPTARGASEAAPAATGGTAAADEAALAIENKLVAQPVDEGDAVVDKARKAIKAPAPVATSKPVTIDSKFYTITIEPPTAATHGADSYIKLSVVPKTGWKLNLEFPTKIELSAPGVTLAKAKFKKADAEHFSEKKANWKLGFKSAEAGQKAFSGKFKFAVCTDATCDPKTEKLAFNVSVK